MALLFDAILIVTIMVWVLGLALHGNLDSNTAVWVLVGLVILAAVGRGLGSSLIRLTFRLALPVASLLTFAAIYGQSEMLAFVGYAAVAFFLLFGLYIMVRGFFPRPR